MPHCEASSLPPEVQSTNTQQMDASEVIVAMPSSKVTAGITVRLVSSSASISSRTARPLAVFTSVILLSTTSTLRFLWRLKSIITFPFRLEFKNPGVKKRSVQFKRFTQRVRVFMTTVIVETVHGGNHHQRDK